MRAATLAWGGEAAPGARWPAPVNRGDAIGVFAPAHTFDPDEAARGANFLRSLGFKVKIPRAVFKKRRYLAGTDSERLAVMEGLMADDKVCALMAVRGGFGCQRLLPALESRWNAWPDKAIFGFSDLTALHLARLKASGTIGFHAPMLVSLGKENPGPAPDKTSRNDLEKALRQNKRSGRWNFAAKDVLRPGQAKGPLLGGNLTLFTALLPSPWLPDPKGAILMLEETGEPGYRLDRLLVTFRQSPAFGQAAALVFGSFTGCGPAREVRALLKEITAGFPGPVLINAPFGHGTRNRLFPIGALAAIRP